MFMFCENQNEKFGSKKHSMHVLTMGYSKNS